MIFDLQKKRELIEAFYNICIKIFYYPFSGVGLAFLCQAIKLGEAVEVPWPAVGRWRSPGGGQGVLGAAAGSGSVATSRTTYSAPLSSACSWSTTYCSRTKPVGSCGWVVARSQTNRPASLARSSLQPAPMIILFTLGVKIIRVLHYFLIQFLKLQKLYLFVYLLYTRNQKRILMEEIPSTIYLMRWRTQPR